MKFFLTLVLAFQAGTANDVDVLRQMLGLNYTSAVDVLNTRNQVILQNAERQSPQQAGEMRARMAAPPFPADLKLSLDLNNIGQGMVLFLFEHDLTTERINLFFCGAQPAQGDVPARTERLVAIQVLFDDRTAPSPTVDLFQTVYGMPPALPLDRFGGVATYPLIAGLPGAAWDLGSHEALYQIVRGNALVTGQLWLTDKNLYKTCANPAKLTL